MASTMISALIFFIATIVVASAVSMLFVSSVDTQNAALNSQRSSLEQKVKTDYAIEVFGYNDQIEEAILYIRNSGYEKINPERLDVYINGSKIDKCTDYLVEITADSEIIDAEYFNPGEILRIAFTKTLSLTNQTTVVITDSSGNREILNSAPLESNENFFLPATGIC